MKRNVTDEGATELEGAAESDGLRLCAMWFGRVSMSLTEPEERRGWIHWSMWRVLTAYLGGNNFERIKEKMSMKLLPK